MAGTIKRKIYFYRVEVIAETGQPPRTFDPRNARTAVATLRWDPNSDPQSRYMSTAYGDWVAVWTHDERQRPRHVRLIVGNSRRGGLPLLDELGTVSPLVIGGAQNLLDPTHVVFFEHGIVGAEFNFHGPRVTRLCQYFAEKCPALPRIKLHALIDNDIQEKLSRLGEVRTVRIRLRRNNLDLLPKARRSLFDSLGAAGASVDAPVVDVVFRQEDYVRQSLGRKAWGYVRALAGAPDIREAVDVLKVTAIDENTGRSACFDFLQDKFAFSCDVEAGGSTRHRSVESTNMYAEIEKAYNQHKEALEKAAEMIL